MRKPDLRKPERRPSTRRVREIAYWTKQKRRQAAARGLAQRKIAGPKQ